MDFSDGEGQTQVRAFGVGSKQVNTHRAVHEQAEVLFSDGESFAIDPCKFSLPNQVILARVPRKDTLAATWEDVRARMKTAREKSRTHALFMSDQFLVPNFDIDIRHRFAELEGKDKPLANSGFEDQWIDRAEQRVRFKMDRGGVELKSEAILNLKSDKPESYRFDGPFLLVMKKRDGERPYLVMWMGNSELMDRR